MIDGVLEGLTADDVGRVCLVTGGAGYLGTHLVDALVALGCEVRVFDRVAVDREGVTSLVGDIRDLAAVTDACRGVDTVFHTAAQLTLAGVVPPRVRRQVMGVNVLGTEVVLGACREVGVPRVVYTSSANVAIDRAIHEGTEDDGYAQSFVDLYGESKVEAEKLVLASDGARLRTVALRPGGIWGGGPGGFMIQTFLKQLAGGSFVATIGDGEAVVDNTHVQSLVRAHLLAAQGLTLRAEVVGGQAYFITDNERINGITWFKPIVDGLGMPWPRRRLPGRLMYAVGHALEWAARFGAPEAPITRIGILKLIRTSSFSIDKARRDLGYEPLISSAEGLVLHLPDYRATVERLRAGS